MASQNSRTLILGLTRKHEKPEYGNFGFLPWQGMLDGDVPDADGASFLPLTNGQGHGGGQANDGGIGYDA